MNQFESSGFNRAPVRRHPARATVTVQEAAMVLGVSRSSAYELVRSGAIPSLRLGHRLVVPRRALMQMVDGPADDAA